MQIVNTETTARVCETTKSALLQKECAVERIEPRAALHRNLLGDRVVDIFARKLLDEGRTVVELQQARAVGVEKQLVLAAHDGLETQCVPLLNTQTVGAATDVLLTAPMPYDGRHRRVLLVAT